MNTNCVKKNKLIRHPSLDPRKLKSIFHNLKKPSTAFAKKMPFDTLKDKTINEKIEFKKSMNRNKISKVKNENPKLAREKNKTTSKMFVDNAVCKLKSAHFRFLNEKLYTNSSEHSQQYFKNEPSSFLDYHRGFQQQVAKWPVNPLDIIIQDLQISSENLSIADFGCGDAKIAETFPNRKIYSFDFQALNKHVQECDISKVPLLDNSVDIVVFCLSLMGTNFKDYLTEATRVLKNNGVLYIAEVKSRFEKPEDFVTALKLFGLTLLKQDWSDKMFVLLKWKTNRLKFRKNALNSIQLNPCLYKKR